MRSGQPPGAELSMPELMHQLSNQTVILVRKEFELAKVELSQKGKVARESAIYFGATALFGIGAFGALTLVFIGALANIMSFWLAALIVAVIYGLIAVVAVNAGQARLKKMASPLPTQAVQSVHDDVEAVRQGMQKT